MSIAVTAKDAGALNCLGGYYYAGQASANLDWSGVNGYINTNVMNLNGADHLVSYVGVDNYGASRTCGNVECWQQAGYGRAYYNPGYHAYVERNSVHGYELEDLGIPLHQNMQYTVYYSGTYDTDIQAGLYISQINGISYDWAWLPTPTTLNPVAVAEMLMGFPGTCGYLAPYQWFGTDGYGNPYEEFNLERGEAFAGFFAWTLHDSETYADWPFQLHHDSYRYFSVNT